VPPFRTETTAISDPAKNPFARISRKMITISRIILPGIASHLSFLGMVQRNLAVLYSQKRPALSG
jgi:hypothetical protein